MRWIIQANIDRFRDLRKTETDATKRTMEMRLLAEEEAKLKVFRPREHQRDDIVALVHHTDLKVRVDGCD